MPTSNVSLDTPDSNRSSVPRLPEPDAPWAPAPAQELAQLGDLALTHGGRLPLRLAYELFGPPDGPTVAVLGGISAGSHPAASPRDPAAGWWQSFVGPGRAVDTRRFRVLSFDYVGGNGASTGPRQSREPERFPSISTQDQAVALARLLDHLGIPALYGLVGSSYGGMVGLAFAAWHGERLERLVAICAADRSQAQSTAWRSLQRQIARLGLRGDLCAEGLALSRALAMVTYRSPEELAERFTGPPRKTARGFRFPVEEYLQARGQDFAGRFDPHAFLRLSESIDLHQVEPRRVRVPTTLVAASSDQLVPLAQVRRLAQRLGGPCHLRQIDSPYGHDAFLKEISALTPIVRRALGEEVA